MTGAHGWILKTWKSRNEIYDNDDDFGDGNDDDDLGNDNECGGDDGDADGDDDSVDIIIIVFVIVELFFILRIRL